MLDTAPRRAGGGVATRRMPIARFAPDAVVLTLLYAGYTLVRNRVRGMQHLAVARGRAVLRLEARLHVAPEHRLNHALAVHPALATVADYYYSLAHFAVTVVVLAVLYWRRPDRARVLAAVWYLGNLLGLVGFWVYALAPPRLLPGAGFIDTVVQFHTWGSWASPSVAASSNQYAAMPSLHTAWAAWAAVAVFSITRRWWVRLLALAYPAATILVVLATANHYLLDVVAGLGVVAAAMAVVTVSARRLTARPGVPQT
jgi:hypothetical protein